MSAPTLTSGITAARAALVSCHVCGKLSCNLRVPKGHHARCPRCHAPAHSRKPDSLNRAWALALAAFILYIPANVFPIMTVVSLGNAGAHTIMGGVVALWEAGMVPLALVVFFASVFVPLLKLLALVYLLLSVQLKWRARPRQRTSMYRIVEGIGRWSMLDIFVIAILISLVRLGNLATIVPGVGATAFAAVVVLTMFAASSFDPRLIWDSLEEQP